MSDHVSEDRGAALRGLGGRAYWRGVRELLDDPAFREAAAHEFPAAWSGTHADSPAAALGGPLADALGDAPGGLSRRDFLRLMGASLALAGVGGCIEPPRESILPYTYRPPGVTPGVARYFATTMPLDGYGTGLLIESHEGRPTKAEGNPLHPASLGAAGVYEQASVLQLYDPQRARRMRRGDRVATWIDFIREFGPAPLGRGTTGAVGGVRFLFRPTTSPLTVSLTDRLRDALPAAGVTYYAPLASSAPLEAATAFFGRPVQPQYDFAAADVVLALDADFLAGMPFYLRYARDWARLRGPASPGAPMSRLYVAEGTFSPTGAMADHRLRVRTSAVGDVAAGVLADLVRETGSLPAGAPPALAAALQRRAATAGEGGRYLERWVSAVARDLRASAGRSIVVAGERQPAEVHTMVYALNALLGNVGRTVRYTQPPLTDAGGTARPLYALAEELHAGAVDTLVILGGNPVYDAPADLDLHGALGRVRRTVYLGLYENETAAACQWFLPALHYLESWGDLRAWDGTASIVQPLVRPLYGGRTRDDVLAAFVGLTDQTVYGLLRELWRGRASPAAFDAFWDDVLSRGVIPDTGAALVDARPRWDALAAEVASAVGRSAGAPADHTLEIVFTQDASVYDGRFANNAWLQELPDPLTKLTWDNAAIISPRTAAELGVEGGRVAALRSAGHELTVPVFVLPGLADGVAALPLGYGRKGAEAVAHGVGVNAYRLRTTAAPYFATGATLEPRAARYALATTQTHWTMEGRPIVLSATLEEYRSNPEFTEAHRGPVVSLYRPFALDTGDQWTMAIDLTLCTGCSSCVVACQTENNSPVVGKAGVLRSREMQWLRIDRYYTGGVEAPEVVFQPMLCQHCETAPCEYVCPVNATVHSPDGLNEMIYNRCVGTRFCSNNCPYKVRRFNWLDYNVDKPETLRMPENPDVTVRARGVMEKCTFCVQRIRRAQESAALEERPLRPDEVRTACQQACPTRAIWFGSRTDPDEELLRRLRDPRRYAVLHDRGTEPRVRYLARITNPNSTLEA